MLRDNALLEDILRAARLILAFTKDVDEARFMTDELIQSGVMKQFENIGEAAGLVSTAFSVDHPEIPWHGMVSMRNRLIHGYSKVRLELVWKGVKTDISALIALIEPLVPPEEE